MSETKTSQNETKSTKSKGKKQTVKETKPVENQFDINNISPELFAQFQAFMAMQQANEGTTLTATSKSNDVGTVYDRRWLKTQSDREVRVTSCYNLVVYKSRKTGNTYKWMKTGDSQFLTVQEIIDMDYHSQKFLHTPWLLIEDEDIVEAMGLTGLYTVIQKLDDADEFFALPLDEIEKIVKGLSKGYKDNLAQIVNQKVEDKTLRDIVVIKKMEELLNKDFYY